MEVKLFSFVIIISTVIIICFSIIHFLEVNSFIARYAGIAQNNKAFGFLLNRAVLMLTRFFTMMLMPLLGLMVDLRPKLEDFLIMIHLCLLGAFLFSLLSYLNFNRWVIVFKSISTRYRSGSGLLLPTLFMIFTYMKINSPIRKANFKKILAIIFRENSARFVFISCIIVFSIYSISIFVAFFFALHFYDYRSSIGQISAVSNAFATVLLTFYVEPKIAVRIDNSKHKAHVDTHALILGRLIGVGVLSQLIISFLWFFI